MKVDIIKKYLAGFTNAWLVKKGKKYFVVSGVNAMYSGWEVLIFPSTKQGKITDWGEVAGGRGMTHEEAIQELV